MIWLLFQKQSTGTTPALGWREGEERNQMVIGQEMGNSSARSRPKQEQLRARRQGQGEIVDILVS